MDPTSQAILVGAISGGIVAVLGAIGVFIVNQRVSRNAAKQTDIDRLEASYSKLQATYEAANGRLNNELAAERNARRADKLECQTLIDGLQRQLTALLAGPLPVKIIGIDTEALPALPVKITDVREELVLPMELKAPIPLTITQMAQAAAQAASDKEST